MSDRPYHHGDLRNALLQAAEAELEAHGIEAFSLRQVAKRAGVSHAAPAHHFSDANGLLTALAAEGFDLFLATQAMREVAAPATPRAQLIAAGLGYVDFALNRPALFDLLFGSARPNYADPNLYKSAEAAYRHLSDQVRAAGGQSQTDLAAVWSTAHGLASLLAAGRLRELYALPAPERDAAIASIVARALP